MDKYVIAVLPPYNAGVIGMGYIGKLVDESEKEIILQDTLKMVETFAKGMVQLQMIPDSYLTVDEPVELKKSHFIHYRLLGNSEKDREHIKHYEEIMKMLIEQRSGLVTATAADLTELKNKSSLIL